MPMLGTLPAIALRLQYPGEISLVDNEISTKYT
jgi:hypothetical protein